MTELKVGIAGFGVVGKKRKACVDRHPNLRLVAVCDRNFDDEGLLEDIDALDVTEETTIDIGDTNSGLSYVTAYQGGVTSGTMTLVSVSGSTINVNASGVSGSGTLFKKGDFSSISFNYHPSSKSEMSSSMVIKFAIPPLIFQQHFQSFTCRL